MRTAILLTMLLAACSNEDLSDAGVGTDGGPARDGGAAADAGGEDGATPDDAGAPVDGGDTDAGAIDAGPGCGPQTTRLRVTNRCAEPFWIGHSDNLAIPEDARVDPGTCFDVAVPDERLEATRIWPRTGCDASGRECQTGQSVAPCPTGGCSPPFESKFEATWADPTTCPPSGGDATCVTWYNASQVDGYTLPFTIVPSAEGDGCVTSDCSMLSLAQCPAAEDLSQGGLYPELSAVDLRVQDGADTIACLAPCKMLTYPAPWGLGIPETDPRALPFCCPTPPISPEQCTAGPVATSDYVTRLQTMCPSVYSYAYDDADGLHTCPAPTQFEVVFCP
ncbi:MAG: hypothetical protein H6719_17820 [Sandaracinaceae bacterium]|nr:hypothetical protein [Sandaracinaceae bacterium]